VTATDTSNAAAFGDFSLTVGNVNDAPVLAQPIANQAAVQDAAFSFTLATSTFADPDLGDTLTYSARLASGAALPAWLSFDAATRTLSGTPTNADVGALNLVVTATDSGGLTVDSNDFTLVVANVNDAPVLAQAIGTQTAAPGVAFGFALPAATFSDPDGDTLSYSATLASGAPLPAWLSFDPATQSFAGTPRADDIGQYAVRLTATDSSGAATQASFVIRVAVPAPAPAPAPAGPTLGPQPQPAVATAEPAPTANGATMPVTKPVATAPPTPGRSGGNEWLASASVDGSDTLTAVTSGRNGAETLAAARPGSRSDAVLAETALPTFSELTTPLAQLLHNDDMLRKFDEMQRQMDEGADMRRSITESGAALSAGLSIGYVVWLVRGGVLLSSVLSALPAWQMVDPLPVLAATRKRDRRGGSEVDEAEVERMFDESNTPDARVDRTTAPHAAQTSGDAAAPKEMRG